MGRFRFIKSIIVGTKNQISAGMPFYEIGFLHLICPECDHEMRIISFITEMSPIEKILKHLGHWTEESSRAPPIPIEEVVYTPIDDGWHSEMDDLVS